MEQREVLVILPLEEEDETQNVLENLVSNYPENTLFECVFWANGEYGACENEFAEIIDLREI